MRVCNYRDDVLWAVAYKLGLNPSQEFLSDEGESLASYINAWVRRGWDSTDFPEWTTIKEFTPDANHQVPWRPIPVGEPAPVVLSRPLKVYLVDPRLSPYPIDTRFRTWDEGVHVGFDHGATVWIKYMDLAPKFTSKPWDSVVTYTKGDLTYSPLVGSCFKSLIYNNIGNDPAALVAPNNLVVDVTVPYAPGSVATTTVPEKWSVRVDLLGLYALAGKIYSLTFLDADGVSHTVSYTTTVAGGTVDALLTALIAAVGASGDAWLTSLTLSKDLPNSALIAQLSSASFSVSAATVTSPADTVTGDDALAITGDDGLGVVVAPTVISNLLEARVSQYAPAQAAIPPTSQVTVVYLQPAQVVAGSTWTITVSDAHGVTHVAAYEALVTDGATEIINGILAAFNPTPPDDFFEHLVVTANYGARTLTIVSAQPITVQAAVTPLSTYWEEVLFPYALIEPVVDGAYADALREAGQTDKAMAEQQNSATDFADRVTKALVPGYTDLTDARAPAPRYQSKLPAQGPPK